MSCCNTSNPLRRDGTSQKQRFPQPLSETYVQIDERSLADMLNFTRELAAEFVYFDYANMPTSHGWASFFEDDLSFLLAQTLLTDLREYRDYFAQSLAQAQQAVVVPIDHVILLPRLERLFQSFLADNVLSTGKVITPLPQLMSRWVKLFPSSEMFADAQAYSFQDHVSDARKRLAGILKKLQVAQAEASAVYGIDYPYDPTAWGTLRQSGWDLLPLPITLPTSADDYTYFNSTQPDDDLDGVLELLKVCHDTVTGMVEKLQAAIPQYLTQSFEQYAWHNPQTALFLAFLLLFKHTQDHINSLGRKHLRYQYKDVLRFKERDFVGDEAVLIMQLRKGIASHVIPAGTLLKADKDKLGRPRYYGVTVETVINQAQIKTLQTVFVERSTLTYVSGGNSTEFETIEGIFAAPKANSQDGLGADLDKADPKWNMFGEAQLAYLPTDRTMPDATLGFAVASPLLMLKEGHREVILNFELDRAAWDSYKIARLGKIPGNFILPEIACNLLHGMKVQYTTAKGWAIAEVAHLLLVGDATTANIPDVKAQLDLGTTTVDYTKTMILSIKIVLFEGMEACTPYLEKTHAKGMATKWPVLQFTTQGRSNDFEGLGIPAFTGAATEMVIGEHRLFGGHVLKAKASGKGNTDISKFDVVASFEEVLAKKYQANVWSGSTNYPAGSTIFFDGGVYKALAQANPGQSPATQPATWQAVIYETYIYEYLRLLAPRQLSLKVDVTGMAASVLENDAGRLKTNKPFQPFGPIPVVGSRLYVGAKEIFGKTLETLSLSIVWQDPPTDLADYYKKYPKKSADTSMTFLPLSYASGKYYAKLTAPTPTLPTQPVHQAPYETASGSYILRKSSPRVLNVVLEEQGKNAAEEKSAPTTTTAPPFPTFSNLNWTADFSLLYEGVWMPLAPTQRRPLFCYPASGEGAKATSVITFSAAELNKFGRDLDLSDPQVLQSNTPRGFLQLELSSPTIAFGHKDYRDLYVTETIRVSRVTPVPNPATPDFPKEPYTPVIKELKISYSSKAVIKMQPTEADAGTFARRVDQFFHIFPFGQAEQHPYLQAAGTTASLVPIFEEEGYLYMGIEGLVPPCTLSLLFQLAEGTADPDLDRLPVAWSFLVDNVWQDLPSRKLLLDTTDGLIASGVIRFEIDEGIDLGNTILNGSLHWLRAKVNRDTAAFLKAIAITAQAVIAKFESHDNELTHLAKALPKETIAAFKTTDPKVKSVAQPFASFGGKLPEQDREFLTRVSERLRHKQRSINVWDYERMVLEEFPSIYKVKCLNHTELQAVHIGGKDWEISPGHVTVVCIPDLRNLNAVNLFEPKTSVRVLRNIDKFLRTHISAWVDLRVANPLYEQIKINCRVGFVTGKDPGFYLVELERSIQQYLSPWAFDNAQEIVFGGNIHRSHIIRYIEQHDYVDYVLDFQMDHITPAGTLTAVVETHATTGRSILVSAMQHNITHVDATCLDCLSQSSPPQSTHSCCDDGSSGGGVQEQSPSPLPNVSN